MEGISGSGVGAPGGYAFAARPQVVAGKNQGPYRDPYREYM